MYSKLNLTFKKPVSLDYKGDYISTYGLISYYRVNRAYTILPIELLKLTADRITWTEVSPEACLPHRDQGVSVNLNIYIDPGQAVTKFYNINTGANPYSPNTEKFYPNLYRSEDLEFSSEFLAQPGEAYLLDVGKVHQVVGLEKGLRSMIQLSWNSRPYDEILEIINRL
jgi:hypothetical protein